MKCLHPLAREITPGISYMHRCGQCANCRLTRRLEWTARILMEMRLHRVTSWTTLTYAPENFPPHGSLQKRDVQLLHKRMRKSGHSFRYFVVGEYGSKTQRPHYHGIYFGMDPETLEKALQQNWRHGYTMTRECSVASAKYTAKYTLKKLTNPKDWYKLDSETRCPEFSLMSRRPGVGLGYLPKIIKHWQRTPIADKEDPRLIRIEGKQYPLDPYVQRKLLELAGKEPPDSWSTHFRQRFKLLSEPPPETSSEQDTHNAKRRLKAALARENPSLA